MFGQAAGVVLSALRVLMWVAAVWVVVALGSAAAWAETRVASSPPPLPKVPWTGVPTVRGQSPTAPLRADTVRQLAAGLLPAVVRVNAKTAKGKSQGSAFLINPEGYMVSNCHVVEGARSVRIQMHEGEERDAVVVALDPLTDLALLYTAPKPGERLPYIALADSAKVEVGQWAVALGAPLSYDSTVTLGIVSALHRRGSRPKNPDSMKEYMQFDAPINPGSSGGPLVDLQGRVVGVVTAMRKDAKGLAFAIPINRVKRVLPRMISGKSIRRAWSGIGFQHVDPMMAESLGIAGTPYTRGALVKWLNPIGPAAKAGVEVGDVLVELDGRVLRDADDLVWWAATSPTDRDVPVRVVRAGQARGFTMRLVASRPNKPLVAVPKLRGPAQAFGIGVVTPSPQVLEALGMAGVPGVLVHRVARRSPAARAGLSTSQVIERVGDVPVRTPNAFYAALEAARTSVGVARVLVWRGGSARWIVWRFDGVPKAASAGAGRN